MLLPLGILGTFWLNNFLKETYSLRKSELEKSIGNTLDKNIDLGDYVGLRFLGVSLGNSKLMIKKISILKYKLKMYMWALCLLDIF